MKTNRTPSFALLLVAASLLHLASCVQEGIPDCRRNAAVTLTFTLEQTLDGEPAARSAEVATVYTFDGDDRLVATDTIHSPLFGEEYTLKKALPPGAYTFVAWVNHHEHFYVAPRLVEDEHYKDAATLYLDLPESRVVDYPLSTLYHGIAAAQVAAGGEGPATEVPLRQNTNRVRLRIKGLPRTGDSYLFTVADSNGAYDFDNNYASCKAFDYSTPLTSDAGGNLEGSLTLLRFGHNRSPRLSVRNATTGSTLYPGDQNHESCLVQLILNAYRGQAIDFDRRHSYDLELTFDPETMRFIITVDGWEAERGGYYEL